MPLMRGAGDMLARLEAARQICRDERRYIRGETQKLIEFAGRNAGATQTLAHNILTALANIDHAENEIDAIIRDELRPKLDRQSWRETRRLEELEKRMASLEKEIEELRRPKPGNVVDLKQRKEGNAK